MLKSKNNLNTLITSTSFNPWFNLAIEEFLINNVNQNEVILYLWQNKDTVVIGSNQNPWKECDINKIKEDEIKLARRLSGGGAVYHDIGNLNFTFIMRKELYNVEKQLNVILNAVNSFGLDAKFSGRNDLLFSGKKFSGNAYYFGEGSSYHHGTILINSDLSKLSQYLKPSKEKIVSKGIDSVRARVVNLHSVNNDITVEKLKLRIPQYFEQFYGKITNCSEFTEEKMNDKSFIGLYERYSSWQWIYGESPSFDVYYEQRFQWGEIQIGLKLCDGYICDSTIFSDALNTSFAKKISDVLLGVRFDPEDIKKSIISIASEEEEKQIFKDVIQLF